MLLLCLVRACPGMLWPSSFQPLTDLQQFGLLANEGLV